MEDKAQDMLLQALKELSENQAKQLELQRESLHIQQEQYRMALESYEKQRELQQRAEVLQNKSAGMMELGRKLFFIVIPILVALIAYLSWMLFR